MQQHLLGQSEYAITTDPCRILNASRYDPPQLSTMDNLG